MEGFNPMTKLYFTITQNHKNCRKMDFLPFSKGYTSQNYKDDVQRRDATQPVSDDSVVASIVDQLGLGLKQ